MTPEQYRVTRRAADRARYLAQRTERLAKARAQYHGSSVYRERVQTYQRGYAAGKRKAAKDAAESFADFAQPCSTPFTTTEH